MSKSRRTTVFCRECRKDGRDELDASYSSVEEGRMNFGEGDPGKTDFKVRDSNVELPVPRRDPSGSCLCSVWSEPT